MNFIRVGNASDPPTGPTPDRMVELWDEMKRWPAADAMNFALCLANLAMDRTDSSMIDGGIYDGVRGADVYLVAACGPRCEPVLRAAAAAARGTIPGDARCVKEGERPTPLSGGERR